MNIQTARPRLPADNPALYRDCDADAATLPDLLRSLTAPTADQVTAAFCQSIRALAAEFSTDKLGLDRDAAAARLALRVAARLADPSDRRLLELINRAEAPRARCACMSEDAAWQVHDLAGELRDIADEWDGEAAQVLGEAA